MNLRISLPRLCALVLIGGLAAAALAAPPATLPAAAALPRQAAPSPEEVLWRGILDLARGTTAWQAASPDTAPALATRPAGWFVAEEKRQARLLERLRLYQTLYPGGVHRDEAILLELTTLFELGALRGGDLGPLRGRLAPLLADPPSPTVAEEAAYWDLLCRRPKASSQPAPGDPATAALDPTLLAAYRQYLARYPASRHAPRLATLLFESAAARGARDEMAAALAHLVANFPDHAATRAVQAHWQRLEALGRPFTLTFTTADQRLVDTRALIGRPVLVLVWAGYDAASRGRAAEVEALRRTHPDLQVIGVSLDDTPERADAALRALGLDWPTWHDGLGWGHEFVRTWGIRELPFVFVIDRAGRLLGSTAGDEWRTWAQTALADTRRDPH